MRIGRDGSVEQLQQQQDKGRFVRRLPAPARQLVLDLADMVGGGDGTGNGRKNVGIDPRSGSPATPAVNHVTGPNAYNTVAGPANPHGYIDGVFVPHGAGATVTLDSAGHTFDKFVDASHAPWGHLINGPVATRFGWLRGIDFNSARHSMIGIHNSKGITFDLEAIRRDHRQWELHRFTALAGVEDAEGSENGDVIFYVFLDGKLVTKSDTLSRNQTTQLNVVIPAEARFLTLVSTDGGDDGAYDRGILGDPRLHLREKASQLGIEKTTD